MSDNAHFRIAVAQPLVVPGNVAENLNRMEPLVAQAAAAGARLVLFSEDGLTGYDHRLIGVGAALTLSDPALDRCAALARQYNLAIVAGFYERCGDALYNSSTAFLPDGRRVLQHKDCIVGFEKTRTAVQPGGRRREIFEFEGLRFAILICADAGMPDIYPELSRAGVDCILLPTAGSGSATSAFRQGELANPARREQYLKAAESVCHPGGAIKLALELDLALACCNQSGWEPEMGYFHPGHSSITDRTGQLTALIPGSFVAEHLRPQLAIGFVTRRA
jgi:predicted amidohydrolase